MAVRRVGLAALVAALLAGMPQPARADLIATLPGNDCPGAFGASFPECVIPDEYDPSNTPVIVKFDFVSNGAPATEVNSDLFPTISGDEFSFAFTGEGTGTWTYTPDADDPLSLVSFYVAKGGPSFNLFSNPGGVNTNSWMTPINPNNDKPFGLSHLTFYEGGAPPPPIPEPATIFLMGAGLTVVARRLRHGTRPAP